MTWPTLRVLTLNCWNVSEPFDQRMALVRAGIEALRPDLIGLQEVIVRRDGFDQAQIILDGLGYQRVFGAAFHWNEAGFCAAGAGDSFGNVVASRWPIARHDVQALPNAGTAEYRCAVAAIIGAPFGRIPFVTTHLHWQAHHGFIREQQMPALAEVALAWARDAEFPPILVGDLNADPDSNEIRYLSGLCALDGRSVYFQDAWRVAGDAGAGYTWDNRNRYAALTFEPNRRIDYIFVGPANSSGRGWIESTRIVLDTPRHGVFPSDHFGLLADIRT
jgi:endonuclease/exonuclease/phosphatase family metal-dependent hydrolase